MGRENEGPRELWGELGGDQTSPVWLETRELSVAEDVAGQTWTV